MDLLSLVCLGAGAALTLFVPRTPVQQAIAEGLAGSLIIGGLALIVVGLPPLR